MLRTAKGEETKNWSIDSMRTTIVYRHQTNGSWPRRDEQIADPSVVGEGVASDLLENVKTVALGNVFCTPR